MSLIAIYTNRKGASINRVVSQREAVDILELGRFGATTARIEDQDGNILGERYQNDGLHPELRSNVWLWCYDSDAMRAAA